MYIGLMTLISKMSLFQSTVRAYLCCFHWQKENADYEHAPKLIKPSSVAYLLKAGKVYLASVQLTIKASVQINKTRNSTAKRTVWELLASIPLLSAPKIKCRVFGQSPWTDLKILQQHPGLWLSPKQASCSTEMRWPSARRQHLFFLIMNTFTNTIVIFAFSHFIWFISSSQRSHFCATRGWEVPTVRGQTGRTDKILQPLALCFC